MSKLGPAPDIVEEAYRHCSQLVRAQDKDRFLASLYAPAERRPYLFALYAFALEIARVKALVKEPLAGTIRLQWWLEAIGGLRAEEAAASPVMIALNDASRQTGVALAPLAAAVEARQDEPAGKPAVAAVSAILIMAARLLDADGDAIAAAAEHAAQALTFIADDPQQARVGYIAFREQIKTLPERALPAFLPVALVPLLLRRPDAPQWRRQIALLRAARFGFAKF
jgi:phytoene/squalene synthetase